MLSGGIATGVILAGGLGTRLRPAIGDGAKSAALVGGHPFIDRLLDQLAGSGVERIVVCAGYQAREVEAAAGREHGGVPVVYSVEEQPLGTGGALRQARARLGDGGAWLVMNGDSYCGIEVEELAVEHAAAGLEATLALVTRAGAGALNNGSTRTVPVNHSAGPLLESCEPFRLISMILSIKWLRPLATPCR